MCQDINVMKSKVEIKSVFVPLPFKRTSSALSEANENVEESLF